MDSQKSSASNDVPKHQYYKITNIKPGDVILEEDLWLYSFRSRYFAKLRCNFCFKEAKDAKSAPSSGQVALQRCTACKIANYCSKECQQRDWKRRHKLECATMQHFVKSQANHWRSSSLDPAWQTQQNAFLPECVQAQLVMASKAIDSIKQKQGGKSDDETKILAAFENMPENMKTMVLFKTNDPFLTKQMKAETILRVLPAMLALRNEDDPTETMAAFGTGICLEMARFGFHSCNPNAVALLGDGRTVRVIATAEIESLSDVRLQRSAGLVNMNSLYGIRKNDFAFLFGYECKCERCVGGDENDTVNMVQLHCPDNDTCAGKCGNFSYAAGCGKISFGAANNDHVHGDGCSLNSSPYFAVPFPTNTYCAFARSQHPWVQKVTAQLTPCSVCGARYTETLVGDKVAEITKSSIHFKLAMIEEPGSPPEHVPRIVELTKRYLHASCQVYKQIMHCNIISLTGCMNFVDRQKGYHDKLSKMVLKLIEDENDNVREYLESQLCDFSDVVSGNTEGGKYLLNLYDAGAAVKCFMPMFASFYIWQSKACGDGRRRRELKMCLEQLVALCEQVCEKAKVIVERLLTPKQLEKFYAGCVASSFSRDRTTR